MHFFPQASKLVNNFIGESSRISKKSDFLITEFPPFADFSSGVSRLQDFFIHQPSTVQRLNSSSRQFWSVLEVVIFVNQPKQFTPWDWYIYLNLVDFYDKLIGKYTICANYYNS